MTSHELTSLLQTLQTYGTKILGITVKYREKRSGSNK